MSLPADSATPLLPTDAELRAAIRGPHASTHPVTLWAAELGGLYRDEPSCADSECRGRRGEVVFAIDTWVAEHLPEPHPAARSLTESVGTVVDRLASHQVHAYHLVMTAPDLAHPRVHDAWSRLGEAVHEYVDLSTGLAQRSFRLPPLEDNR